MHRPKEDTQVDLSVKSRSSPVSRKFATSPTEKFRDIFYKQITEEEEQTPRRNKILGSSLLRSLSVSAVSVEGVVTQCSDSVTCHNVGGYLLSLVPILSWLPAYRWRENMLSDLVAGLTVAIMHIPQGMAYAMLAGVEPVTGIYTGIWPVLVYVMLGNMPHTSMGTFAVVSILVNQVKRERERCCDDDIGAGGGESVV